MEMRKDSEIKIEIKALLELKATVPRLNAFRDDNHVAIDAQVQTLVDKPGLVKTIHDYTGGDPEVLSEAVRACEWLYGALANPPSWYWGRKYSQP
jgi:hypothetical protein